MLKTHIKGNVDNFFFFFMFWKVYEILEFFPKICKIKMTFEN